jgi:coronin-1B/1C/6
MVFYSIHSFKLKSNPRDVKEQKNVLTVPLEDAVVDDLAWNHDGSMLAAVSKDKKIKLIDPRMEKIVSQTNCHEGSKPQKLTWLGNDHKIFTTGFSRRGERQFGFFDSRNLDQPYLI